MEHLSHHRWTEEEGERKGGEGGVGEKISWKREVRGKEEQQEKEEVEQEEKSGAGEGRG